LAAWNRISVSLRNEASELRHNSASSLKEQPLDRRNTKARFSTKMSSSIQNRWRLTGIHVSLCQQKSTKSSGRARESARSVIRILRYAVLPLGWWFLLSAEPDIHLLSETPKSPHRRLSLCSLPVPKQTEGSLWSCLRRPARHLRDLAACAPNDPDIFSFPGKVFTQRPCR
jgi:hypothetical protein